MKNDAKAEHWATGSTFARLGTALRTSTFWRQTSVMTVVPVSPPATGGECFPESPPAGVSRKKTS